MRLVLITPHLPPVKGGISTYSREVIRQVISRDFECRAYSHQGESGPDWEVIHGGSSKFVWRLFIELARLRPDVIHAHAHWYTLLPGAMYRILRPSTRLVFTFHTQPTQRARWLIA